MNRHLLVILLGIAATPVLVQHVSAQSDRNVFATARQSLVLIQNTRGENAGTGFIVAKEGSTYYALTADHVVQDGQFQVRIDKEGEVRPVEAVLRLSGVDLALVQFTSSREYQRINLAQNATGIAAPTPIFVLGYPGQSSTVPEIPGGVVTSRRPMTRGSGTGIFHDVRTEGGMSGSPVLTNGGQVIGIHIGQPERGNIAEAVPIEKYWELAPQIFTRAGRDNLANGNFQQAITSLELVRRIFGQENSEATLVLAYAYFGLNDLGRARDEARKISSTNANAALLLGAIDYISGNDTSAIQNANLAATGDRRTLGGYALAIVGLSQLAMRSNSEAANSINTASSLLREDAFVYLANSCFKFRGLSDIDRARSDFGNANRLSNQRPGDPFLAVLSPRLQERARTCLPPEIGTPPIGNTSALGRYKSSEPISLGASVTTLIVSSDSNFVAVGLNNGRVVIYNLQTKEEVASFNLSQSNSSINSVAFSPNGQDIAFASSNGQLRVFNIRSRNEKYNSPNVGDSPQVVFSNNNNSLFVGSITGSLRRINNSDGDVPISRSDTHPGGITSLILSPDGRLVSGGADGRIRFWNPGDLTASDDNYPAHQGAVTGMAFSAADGSQTISAGVDNLVRACKWRTGECVEVARTNEQIGGLAVAGNGHIAFSERPFLVRPENRIFLRNLNDGQILGDLPLHKDRVVALAYTPNNRFMISGSADQTIIIWEVQ